MKKTSAGGGINQTLADFAFERPLKPRPEVSLSAFSFLFSEIVQQMMKSEKGIGAGDSSHGSGGGGDLDQQLQALAYPIGEKVLELLFFRDKGGS